MQERVICRAVLFFKLCTSGNFVLKRETRKPLDLTGTAGNVTYMKCGSYKNWYQILRKETMIPKIVKGLSLLFVSPKM